MHCLRKQLILDWFSSILVALLCTVFAAWVLGYEKVSTAIPVAYSGDGLYYGVLIKGIIENGWYIHNPYLGAPFGLDMGAFPMADGTHFFVLKLLGALTGEFGSALTLFYLGSFATAAATGFVAMRWIGLQPSFAACGAILFSLQSYHFQRAGHLFLASYFCLPLFVAYAMSIYQTREDSPTSLKSHIGSTILLVVAAGCGVYYAFFACILIGFAALSASVDTMTWRPLRRGLVAGLIIFLAVGASLAPHLQSIRTHTPDGDVAARAPQESEYYGLRLIQMALPSIDHRNADLRAKAATYAAAAPQVTENQTASLGMVAFFGLLISIACALVSRFRRNLVLQQLGMMNVVAFLYATIGGLSAIFAWALTPQLRAPNRISILIAFISLCSILLVLQLSLAKISSRAIRNGSTYTLLLLVTAFCIWDQTPAKNLATESNRAVFLDDKASGEAIMASAPAGSRIYQLPYISFPETAPLHLEGHTGLTRRYLHTKGISWSFGAMKFGEGDQWIRRMESFPLRERVRKLRSSGFDDILVERRAYADQGRSVESQLEEMLGSPSLICPDGSCSLFRLDAVQESDPQPLLLVTLGAGFSSWDFATEGLRSAKVAGDRCSLLLLNPLKRTVRARLYFSVLTPNRSAIETSMTGSSARAWLAQTNQETDIDMQLDLRPGINELRLASTSIDDEDSTATNSSSQFQIVRPIIGAVESSTQVADIMNKISERDRIFADPE
jgi:phosphoglycerol transferase